MQKKLTFVCISDTHNDHRKYKNLPKGDVLIHCGDFSVWDFEDSAMDFLDWLGEQNYKYKVFIAGNHDNSFDKNNISYFSQKLKELKEKNCYYLNNSSIVIEGLKIWGSPHSIRRTVGAFQLEKDELERTWNQLIQEKYDIILTHGPPYGKLDKTLNEENCPTSVGDKELLKKVKQFKPKYHIFGHIHPGYGQLEEDGINYINCSALNKKYQLNNPIVFHLDL